jgi:hypothetical protein
MPYVVYPPTLPAPMRWVGVPRERRAVSTLPGNTQHRNRSRDQLQDIEAFWTYEPEQMATFEAWYETDLVKGQRWFEVVVLGAGGWIARVVRFRTGSLRREHVAFGIYRVSARLEQRGRAQPPLYVPPLVVNSSSGTGFSPTLPERNVGDGILLWAMGTDSVAGEPTMDEAWGTQIGTEDNSDSSMQMKVWGRRATGTVDDEALGWTNVGGPAEGCWITMVIPTPGDHFPVDFSLRKIQNHEPGNIWDPDAINTGDARWIYIVAAMGLFSNVSGWSITADPPGYTGVFSVIYPRGVNSKAQMRVAYKEVLGGYENPGAFTAGGSVANGLIGLGIQLSE